MEAVIILHVYVMYMLPRISIQITPDLRFEEKKKTAPSEWCKRYVVTASSAMQVTSMVLGLNVDPLS